MRFLWVLATLPVAATAWAQPGDGEPVPEAQPARDVPAEAPAQDAPSGSAQSAGDQAAGDQAAGDQAAQRARRALGEAQPAAEARPSRSVPAGEVHVFVLDSAGRVVPGTTVELGVMVQEGSQRSREHLEAGEDGVARFTELSTGSSQAYRVNVYRDGARFSSTPFRLPDDQGYRVQVRLLETTRDERMVMNLLHRTLVELKGERLHITQQVQLVNLSDEQFVFPQAGKVIPLPDGFSAFQSERSMGDQQVNGVEDGVRLTGSLPPGRTDLVWAYDLRIEGREEVVFTSPVGFRTVQVRVDVDAPPGMELDVTGLPAAQPYEAQGRRVLVTMSQRDPSEEVSLSPVVVRLSGIPAPLGSTLRWVALGAAGVFLALGLFSVLLLRRGEGAQQFAAGLRKAKQQELLDEVAELEAAFEREEVGPRYRERRMTQLLDELAGVLRDDEAAEKAGEGPRVRRTRSPRQLYRDAILYLAAGIFALTTPLIGTFLGGVCFVGALRHSWLALRTGPADGRQPYVAMFAISLLGALAWIVFLVWGAVYLAEKLM